jgi:Flp pilus assembly protein CpaB
MLDSNQDPVKEAPMRGNRSLVVIALILIVLVVIVGGAYYYFTQIAGPADEPPVDATMEVEEPVETTEIVVSIQSIPRGMQISEEENAIEMQAWPNENLPTQYFTDMAEVEGKYALLNIPRGMPILPDMIGRPGGMLSVSGSAAALFGPEDRVAYAIPMDTQGAVAWAVQPGDRVDVLASIGMESSEAEFSREGVKQFTYLETPELPSQTSLFGKFEQLPNGRWAAIYPVETPGSNIPTNFVQLTVQNAQVWHVGTWDDTQQQADAAQQQDGDGGGALGEAPEAAPTPVPDLQEVRDIEPVTLLVTREDALILKYLHEMGADLDLVLRPAGFEGTVIQTQPVWFRYVLDKYQLPNTMPDEPVAPSPVREPLDLLPVQTPEPEAQE